MNNTIFISINNGFNTLHCSVQCVSPFIVRAENSAILQKDGVMLAFSLRRDLAIGETGHGDVRDLRMPDGLQNRRAPFPMSCSW